MTITLGERLRYARRSSFWKQTRCRRSGCIEWTGHLSNGYGLFKSVKAHRVSWYFEHGDIPAGAFICHTCDNPSCVNPKHLYLGTPRTNAIDSYTRNRHKGKHRRSPKETRWSRFVECLISDLAGLYGSVTTTNVSMMLGVSQSTVGNWFSGHVSPRGERLKSLLVLSRLVARARAGDARSLEVLEWTRNTKSVLKLSSPVLRMFGYEWVLDLPDAASQAHSEQI